MKPNEIKEIIENINERIAKRQYYGIREVTLKEDNHILTWSNGAKSWFPFSKKHKKGETLKLDANQIIAPYNLNTLKIITEHLNPLPLFDYSFEGKSKSGKTSLDWAILQNISQKINQNGLE